MRTLYLWLLAAAYLPAAQKFPVEFEPNRGQAAPGVAFVGHSPEATLLLSSRSAVLRLDDGRRVAISPCSANPHPRLSAEEPTPAISNYLRGSDRHGWITRVPHFQRVRYRQVYPGIDMVFYGTGSALEYDLVVAPGADPRAIQLQFDGARNLALDAHGNLRIETGGARLTQHRPAVYQEIDGSRHEVAGEFRLAGNRIRFAIGAYDHTRPLVIDPLLRYGSYLGGHSRDVASAIAVDAAGSAYIAGYTVSADFPVTPNALQTKHGGVPNSGITGLNGNDIFDAFVAKFSPDGSRLIYATFLGGSGNDETHGIAVDASGNAVIAGRTSSRNFPLTANALQATLPSGAEAGFVTRLNADGSNLVYSTYFGGASGNTGIRALSLDASGNAYVAGVTDSPSFPATAGALQTRIAGLTDGFAAKINSQGAIVYATYLGGSKEDQLYGLAVDPAGNAYLGGVTFSTDFPGTAGGAAGSGFVSKLNPAGTALVYSKLLTGATIAAIAVDRDNSVLVTGGTSSQDFVTTTGAFQTSLVNGSDAFVVKLDPTGAVTYATLLGGFGEESGGAIAVAADGSAIVGGATTSSNFPLTGDAYQRTLTGTNCQTATSPFPPPPVITPCSDGFLAIVHVSGRRLLYSTLLGGSDDDAVRALALSADGSIYLTGTTGSNDFIASRGAFAESRAAANCVQANSPTFSIAFACEDAFVLKIDPAVSGPPRPVAAVANGANGLAGPVAPGEFVSLFGFGIGPGTADSARLGADGRLVSRLSDTTVTFDGVPAPLLYVGVNQINAIVPFAVAGKSRSTIRIDTPDYGANVASVAVGATAPGLFSLSGTGQGQAAALNQDGTVNGPDNPAARASVIVLYGTGAGQTSAPGVDGRPAVDLSKPNAPISVTIGNQDDATILYAGAAPGLVEGVIQVNAVIPATVAAGSQIPVFLHAGSLSSQANIYIAVR